MREEDSNRRLVPMQDAGYDLGGFDDVALFGVTAK
jgi:hypothetical protein